LIIGVAGTKFERFYHLLLVFLSNFIPFFSDGVDIAQISIFSPFNESDLLCESKNVFDEISDVL
jgi:hypothetical protein